MVRFFFNFEMTNVIMQRDKTPSSVYFEPIFTQLIINRLSLIFLSDFDLIYEIILCVILLKRNDCKNRNVYENSKYHLYDNNS